MSATTAAEVSRFALICHHNGRVAWPGIEVTRWDTRAQAQLAADELTPCGPRCIGAHTVVDVDTAPAPRKPTERNHRITD